VISCQFEWEQKKKKKKRSNMMPNLVRENRSGNRKSRVRGQANEKKKNRVDMGGQSSRQTAALLPSKDGPGNIEIDFGRVYARLRGGSKLEGVGGKALVE